ncbi:MAG: FtsX-like permease family protein, partial [Acidimicrobiales bacterium]
TGASVGPIEPPSELRNLRSVLSYPKVVSGVAALLALGGLASGLLAGAASRRHEMATLRAIGYTGRQVREAVLWQSLAVGLMALTAAVPLGLIVTNWAWRVGAGSLSLDRSLGLPWPTAAVVAAGLLVVAAATAVPIGRGWARRSLALDLRTE